MSRGPDIADRQQRILIVDDDPAHRALLEVMLRPEGFVVLTAASGEEALAMVARQPPDLVLLDVMMPDMNGYEFAEALRADPVGKHIPVIMITSLDDRDTKMLALHAGAEEFLSKPVDRAELCMRVRNLLRLKAYGDYHDKHSQMLEAEVGSRTADLVESERLYRSTFDAAPVGIGHVASGGQWLRVNQRLCDLLGYTCDELEGTVVQDSMRPQDVDAQVEPLAQLMSGTLRHHVIDEQRYQRPDGTFVWARVNLSAHRDAEGRFMHYIAVLEDITERRRLEAQVRQTNKMDAIGRLASGVAHDFNNLLTVISGFAELVAGSVDSDSPQAKDVGEILKAAKRAADLTKQLLAFSRQQVLHAAPLDVNGLITEMAGMLRRLIGEEIEITLSLDPALSLVLVDRGQLEQVVMNLVVNARDALPNGGKVNVTTADVELYDSSGGDDAMMRGHYVLLAVSDTGAGMTEETQRRLFEPFFTTKEVGKGTGLGLSTVYGIVQQSKGYIRVSSEPDHGTTFRVYLPGAEQDLPALADSASFDQRPFTAAAVPTREAHQALDR